METPSQAPAKRGLLARLFLSPEEPRLRAGWRLLIHTVLLIVLVLIFSTLLAIFAVALGLFHLSTVANGPFAALAVQTLALFVSITLATWLVRRWIDRRSFVSLGFNIDRSTVLDLAFGFILPGILFGLIYAAEAGAGWLAFEGTALETDTPLTILGGLLIGLGVFVLVGWQEELLSRGYHLQNLVDGLNLPLGVLLSSSVFALLHLGNPGANWASTLGILAAGFFLAYGWIRTGRLWLSIGLHIGWNFFEGTVFGFPVSGTGGFNFIHQTVQGPELVTGGIFGPEAGIVVLPALALGTLAIWMYTRGRAGIPRRPPETAPTGV
jgi:membrane protease YdiL (CAAX protease family)